MRMQLRLRMKVMQVRARMKVRVRVRVKVRACLKALDEDDNFGEVAPPSAGKSAQRQKSTRRPGEKLG